MGASTSQCALSEVHIQDQIDSLSRRGQGQPKNEEIDEVISRMRAGSYSTTASSLSATYLRRRWRGRQLAGSYDLKADVLDSRRAETEARVSQT